MNELTFIETSTYRHTETHTVLINAHTHKYTHTYTHSTYSHTTRIHTQTITESDYNTSNNIQQHLREMRKKDVRTEGLYLFIKYILIIYCAVKFNI